MANKKSYQSITLYKDMAPQILELEKVEAGEILQAIMRYSCYGEDTDMSQYDRFVRSLWKTIKLKLDAGETHDREISETNRNNAMKRWKKEKGNATACDGIQSNKSDATACDGTTYTNTGTGTNSSTITISSTVTNTEQTNADSGSADLLTSSAAAENAEPSAGDLFSLAQIKKKVKSGKVDLSEEGVKAFYEQMQDDGWMLYGKPVEKRYLLRALREWARKHPEYALEEEQEENPKKKILKNFKSWLRYHGYDANYENGTGDYDEEIAIDEDIICAIWDVKRLSESLNDMNYRLLKAGYESIELRETVMKLYSKYIEETKGSEDE